MNGKNETSAPRPLRLWPGVAAAVLMIVLRLGVPLVSPQNTIYGILGALAAAVVILAWWLFGSRAAWADRLLGAGLVIAAIVVASRIVHPSIRGGMMGNMPWLYGMPVLCFALAMGAAAGRRLAPAPRRASLAVAIALGCAALTLVRTDGVRGEGNAQLRWRWTPTHEERLLAQDKGAPAALPAPAATPVASPSTVADDAPVAGPSAAPSAMP